MLNLLFDKTLEKSKSLRIARKHHQRKQYIVKTKASHLLKLPHDATISSLCGFFTFNRWIAAMCYLRLKSFTTAFNQQ
jgi:hypothetical protein